jgi:hypothetical protein
VIAHHPVVRRSWVRVAAPEQRIGVEAALRAVTIEATYSWRREDDLGSIAPGKIANFTVVDSDPREVDPTTLTDIQVVGTVFEGRWFPISDDAGARPVALRSAEGPLSIAAGEHDDPRRGCGCAVARSLNEAVA